MILSPYRFGGEAVVQLTDLSIFHSDATQDASFTLAADGNVYETEGLFVMSWLNVPASAGLFEVRATRVSGDPGQPAGPLNVWQSCSVDRVWTTTNEATRGTRTGTILVEIRRVSTLLVEASGYITINTSRQATDIFQ